MITTLEGEFPFDQCAKDKNALGIIHLCPHSSIGEPPSEPTKKEPVHAPPKNIGQLKEAEKVSRRFS